MRCSSQRDGVSESPTGSSEAKGEGLTVRSQKQRRRRGATAVEFAMTAPVLFLFVFAAVEFSRANMIRNSAANAAYEGARRGIVPGATTADVMATAHAVADSVLTNGEQVTVSPATINPDTQQVTVTVRVPLDENGWVMPVFFAGKTVVGTCTLRRDLIETVAVP